MSMNIYQFLAATGGQKPLLAVKGNIFATPADHIAFGVHWRNSEGYLNNNNGGFSSLVAQHGWPELENYEFEKGIPVTKRINGKYFHALPIHTPEKGGWEETPMLIEDCLNKLPVTSSEVVACVLIGGGNAGEKYKASVRNLEGMMHTHKTIVLYVHDQAMYDLLTIAGVVARSLPYRVSLSKVPRPMLFKENEAFQKLLVENGVVEYEEVQ